MLALTAVWDAFYQKRRQLYDEHFNMDFRTKQERSDHWQQVKAQLNEAYRASLEGEAGV